MPTHARLYLGAKAYNTLVGHMLPRGTVPEELVIRIFGMVPCREHSPKLVVGAPFCAPLVSLTDGIGKTLELGHYSLRHLGFT